MSNLSNMMISGSYRGLINLEDSTQNLASQSGYIQLQDGLGDNVGASIDASTLDWRITNNLDVGNTLGVTGSAHFRSDVDIDGDLDISGSLTHTGSIDVLGDITASGNIKATIGRFDTVETRVLHVTEESASVIFSSGSNVLGDDCNDRQDLIGQVIVSCSLGVEGNAAFTGSLTVSNEISSSTIAGLGNATAYSQSVETTILNLSSSVDTTILNLSASVDNRLDDLEFFSSSQYQTDSASFDDRIDQLETDTGSQDQRLDSLEAFTGSQETINGFYNQHTQSLNNFTSSQLVINSGYNTFTSSYYIDSASFDLRLDQQEAFSSSLVTDFVSTGSFNSYTQSVDIRLNNLELESSSVDNRLDNIELTTSSLQVEIDVLSSFTGSYATTGSNTFIGDQVFSGSVQGDVHTITVASNTASIDCSQGNFFTLEQGTINDTHLIGTNITGGRTITLRVNKTNSNATISIDTGSIKFPSGQNYVISTGNNIVDVLTFVTFDTTALYAAAGKNFI